MKLCVATAVGITCLLCLPLAGICWGGEPLKLGIKAAEAEPFGVKVIEILPGGLAARTNLKKGDVIVMINKSKITTMKSFDEAAQGARNGAAIVWKRGDVYWRQHMALVGTKPDRGQYRVALREDGVVETGKLVVRNTSTGEIRINVYRPGGGEKAFSSWVFESKKSATLGDSKNQAVIFEADWSVEIVFPDGVRSPRAPIGGLSTGGTIDSEGVGELQWRIDSNEIYRTLPKRSAK